MARLKTLTKELSPVLLLIEADFKMLITVMHRYAVENYCFGVFNNLYILDIRNNHHVMEDRKVLK